MALVPNLALANRVLAALPAPDRHRCLADCELVDWASDEVLLTAGQALAHAWFPVEGCVSLTLPLEDGWSMQIGLIGSEGMFSSSLALGGVTSAFRCSALGSGRAFRIGQAALSSQLQASTALQQVLEGYADVRYRQLAQQAACATRHSVAQRLARWLLLVRDRTQASELFLTHEALALLLGVRRESVTQAARRLQWQGHISYSRGYMMLLDEAALQAQACACYQIERQHHETWWQRAAPHPHACDGLL